MTTDAKLDGRVAELDAALASEDVFKVTSAFRNAWRTWLRDAAIDAGRLDWLDTLQHRTMRSGVHQKEWPIPTDAHAHHGFWAIYLRTGVGSNIEREGRGTIREAIDAARSENAGAKK